MIKSLELHSLTLLRDKNYVKKVDRYAIRLHNSLDNPKGKNTGGWKHLDVCMGASSLSMGIDFILPAITVDEIATIEQGRRFDNFPLHVSKLIIFKPAHEINRYLLDEENQLRLIPSKYGRGWYKIIKKGRASIQIVDENSWEFIFDGVAFLIYRDTRKNQYRMKKK